jgi:hypothetical protein
LRTRVRGLIAASVALVGCSYHVNGVDVGGPGGGGGSPIPVADGGGSGGNGADDMGPRNGDVDGGPPPVAPCYSEDFFPGVSLADLAAAFSPQSWKTESLTTLDRRIPGGHALLDAMKDDPQLPGFVDNSSWANLMLSLMTMCHEETHGYDYGKASASSFYYYMTPSVNVQPPQLQTFARSEILGYIDDASTQNYDQTYLTGQQGSYDLVALADELNAYTNGLACIGAVADQIGSGISARDGVAASLYYLELYLKRARTAHAAVYASLKQSPDWVKFVRYAWARGMFWRRSITAAQLQIAEAPIWAHVDDPASSSEIVMFGGGALSDIECHP